MTDIVAEVDPNADVRKAFLHVVKKVENGTPGNGGGGGGSTDPDPDTVNPIPYNPGAGEAKVPADAAVSEKIVTNGQTQYVTTISAQKVDQLVGLNLRFNTCSCFTIATSGHRRCEQSVNSRCLLYKSSCKECKCGAICKNNRSGL